MKPIKVRMKEGFTIHQPTTRNNWNTGWIVGFVQMADDRGYAVVQTECNEFEHVLCISLEAFDSPQVSTESS